MNEITTVTIDGSTLVQGQGILAQITPATTTTPLTINDFQDAIAILSQNTPTTAPLGKQSWYKQAELEASKKFYDEIRKGSYISGTDPYQSSKAQFVDNGFTLNKIQLALLWSKESQFRGVCANINVFGDLRLKIADEVQHDFVNISDWNTQNYDIAWVHIKQLFNIYAHDGLVGVTTEINRNPAWGEWVDTYNAANSAGARKYILTMQGEMMLVLFNQLDTYDKDILKDSIIRLDNWEKGRKDEKLDELRNDLKELLE